jgi:alkanesulfonate monooxygenase SsuD/methylene tetrahydromethanopterin reductase-like flavin-dependent oxidoreductase (luciferase family)
VWLPSQGSPETIRFAAQRRYPFVTVFTPYANARRLLLEYQEEAQRLGYRARPEQLGLAMPVYVGTTDAAARREARAHILWLFRRGLKIPPHFLAPPGYLSEDTLRRFLLAGVKPPSELTFEELERDGYILVGSPATVRARLTEIQRDLGIGVFIGGGRIGDMSHERALRSAALFAKHVIPHFRRPAKRTATAANPRTRR